MSHEFAIEFIAGGVVKDADGNIVDDSSEKAARERLVELGQQNLIGLTELGQLGLLGEEELS